MSRIVVITAGAGANLLVSALEHLAVDVAALDDPDAARLDQVADGCELLVISGEAPDAVQRRAIAWATARRAAAAPAPTRPARRSLPQVLLTALSGDLDESVVAAADLIVCTVASASQLSGIDVADPLDAEDAAAALAERGAATAVVSLDEQGAVVARPGRATYLPPFTVEVVDRAGAWECFCAAFALAVVEGFDNFAATGYAMAATAVCIGRPGDEASLPTRDDVERMAHSIDLRRDPGTAPVQFPH